MDNYFIVLHALPLPPRKANLATFFTYLLKLLMGSVANGQSNCDNLPPVLNTDNILWLAKCCKIQQLAHSYATTYIYVQQDIFIFNILYLNSTIRIFFQLQPKLFLFNENVCSTSTKNNFIQQNYLFNFNQR